MNTAENGCHPGRYRSPDRFQFVERAAGAVRAPNRRIIGNTTAAGRRSLAPASRRHAAVPYAAGRMLIDNRAIEIQAFQPRQYRNPASPWSAKQCPAWPHIVERRWSSPAAICPSEIVLSMNVIG
ncbi:hypothetical protein KCP70_15620 [Salmonella enterica subsp. enterica]|nr:hypothetical protein KCP70_15620 [Salmonella enterica subsp. enterica]